jgi:hypothetical protein
MAAVDSSSEEDRHCNEEDRHANMVIATTRAMMATALFPRDCLAEIALHASKHLFV